MGCIWVRWVLFPQAHLPSAKCVPGLGCMLQVDTEGKALVIKQIDNSVGDLVTIGVIFPTKYEQEDK